MGTFFTSERLAIVILIAILAITYFFVNVKPSSLNGENVLPTSSSFQLLAGKDDARSSVKLQTSQVVPAGTILTFDERNGVFAEKPEQTALRKTLGITLAVERNRPFIDAAYHFPFSDLGTFAGFKAEGARSKTGSDHDDSFVVGLRTSPCRLAFGILSPDLLASRYDVGAGLSVYLPPDILGSAFAHWGIGYAHLWPLDSGREDNIFYLSFSTYTP